MQKGGVCVVEAILVRSYTDTAVGGLSGGKVGHTGACVGHSSLSTVNFQPVRASNAATSQSWASDYRLNGGVLSKTFCRSIELSFFFFRILAKTDNICPQPKGHLSRFKRA